MKFLRLPNVSNVTLVNKKWNTFIKNRNFLKIVFSTSQWPSHVSHEIESCKYTPGSIDGEDERIVLDEKSVYRMKQDTIYQILNVDKHIKGTLISHPYLLCYSQEQVYVYKKDTFNFYVLQIVLKMEILGNDLWLSNGKIYARFCYQDQESFPLKIQSYNLETGHQNLLQFNCGNYYCTIDKDNLYVLQVIRIYVFKLDAKAFNNPNVISHYKCVNLQGFHKAWQISSFLVLNGFFYFLKIPSFKSKLECYTLQGDFVFSNILNITWEKESYGEYFQLQIDRGERIYLTLERAKKFILLHLRFSETLIA
jgi:hypothetical protein